MTRVHISLPVSDLAASTRFYEGLFGRKATKTKIDYANFRLETPAIHLALVRAPGGAPAPSATSHFGLELPSDQELRSWRLRLERSHLDLETEESVTCCYATADKVWVSDPDGNRWEVWHRTGDAETMGETDSECCDPACCT